jgi:hypothetical protein
MFGRLVDGSVGRIVGWVDGLSGSGAVGTGVSVIVGEESSAAGVVHATMTASVEIKIIDRIIFDINSLSDPIDYHFRSGS